ncbi:flagellar filament capping protein FliD [Azohydromonas aeria]|uniref:flagellar filament capping protein FliD n=1 Tax=Azohydromonas aeria TaxID=2590212 RepID=UPI0012FB5783|nr:flagellar filament capping protein FliD [Azohydromonas aeria]
MSGTVSSLGIGSGLDAGSIVSQLVSLERQPIANLQKAASSIQTQISAYGKVQSLVSDLRDKAAALAGPTLWKQGTATASDPSVLTASSSGAVASGEYSVTVQQIAYSQTLYSRAIATSASMGAGTLSIQLVQDYGPPPVAKSGSAAMNMSFEAGATLEAVRDKINASGAGVTASVVRNPDGTSRLALSAKSTGLNDQIMVTGTDGMADFSYAAGLSGGPEMTQGQAAQNARFTINGVESESTTNQVTGALDGLSLTLNKTSDTPVKVSVANDAEAQLKAMQDFMGAYNALNSYLVTQTRYNASTKTAATLQGDSAAISLRSQLRGLFNASNGAAGVFSSLRAVGFDTSSDGTLKLDTAKAKTALQQPDEVRKLFASTDTATASNDGLAVRFRELADRLNGTDGLVTSRTEGLQTKLKRNQTDQEKLEARVANTKARLEKQYQALDANMSKLNSLSSYVTAQMKALGTSSSDT